MRDRASFTASWVAGWRGLGPLLGDDMLADDPYGARFGGRWALALSRAAHLDAARRALLRISPVAGWVGYMQIRTRAIDDELRAFVAGGGRQVVILGAGYDCRAARFADTLRDVRVVEVDHPATQARKRAVLADAPSAATYLPWDFEANPLADLPSALALDLAAPTLTIWEGVTMYLSEPAIEASFSAIARFGAPSRLVFTYVERAAIERPSARERALKSFLAGIGEPFRWGWDPPTLPDWLASRGWTLDADHRDADLAAAWLPPEIARRVPSKARHVAVASIGTRPGS